MTAKQNLFPRDIYSMSFTHPRIGITPEGTGDRTKHILYLPCFLEVFYEAMKNLFDSTTTTIYM